MAVIEQLSRSQQIIGQYRQVVGVMENMFQIATPKMNEQTWRRDGVGSCCVNRKSAEGGMVGITRGELTRLRDERNEAFGGQSTKTPCPYHREGIGCVLGDLKSPTCITYIENPEEWKNKFNIDIENISRKGRELLRSIQLGETLYNAAPIEEFTNEILGVIQILEKGPLLQRITLLDRVKELLGITS